ncbi:hypothetical protein MTR72_21980 [Bradyrhizobium sp. ISRA442]|uniref:hypothetical protein n=1 Tax=Bradyrhizobium sp. ISRA442 TaxID=2866197 RepID=UPI00311B1561
MELTEDITAPHAAASEPLGGPCTQVADVTAVSSGRLIPHEYTHIGSPEFIKKPALFQEHVLDGIRDRNVWTPDRASNG